MVENDKNVEKVFFAAQNDANGTKLPIRNVRFSDAIGGKADLAVAVLQKPGI